MNGLNQYTGTTASGVPNWTYEYDPNGNLTRAVDPVGTGTTAYLYDVENRLVSASGAVNATLVYDPLGRLVQVTGANGAQTHFLYDGDRMIAEYDGFGTLLKRYVHGPGADEPIAAYDGPALGLTNRRYTMTDERGSIAALINADGSPATINRYDAWGIPGAGNAGRFQYTGQAWIAELGLYHYKARFYSPTLGRFMQVDPIGYEDQMNLYAYVGNDPVNHTDPTGMACDTGSRLGASAFCQVHDGYQQTETSASGVPKYVAHGPRAYGEGGSSRPHRAVPGGRLTEAHVRCRSCHGVGTDDARRYNTEAENELLIELASLFPAVRIAQVPRRAFQVSRVVQKTGSAPRGYVGGRTFQNREGRLPRGGSYREFDIDPRPAQGPRNAERIVIDSKSGRRWYTSDHYDTFTEF